MKKAQYIMATIACLIIFFICMCVKVRPMVAEIQDLEAELKSVYVTPVEFEYILMTQLVPQKSCEEPVAAEEKPAMESLGIMYVTGYDPHCSHCVGKKVPDGITASGEMVTIGKTASMADVSFGTIIEIYELGQFVVEDRGVGPGVIDIACASHEGCYSITGYYEVWIIR